MEQDGSLTQSEKNDVSLLEPGLTGGRKLSFTDACDELVSHLERRHWIHSEKNDGPVPRDFFEQVLTAGRKFSFTDVCCGLDNPKCVSCNEEITLAQSAVRCAHCSEWLHLKKCSGLRRLADRVDTYIGPCCRVALLEMDNGWNEWTCIGCSIKIELDQKCVQCRQCKGLLHARRCSGLKLTDDFPNYLGACCRTGFTMPQDTELSRARIKCEMKVAAHLCELYWREKTPELLPTPKIYGPRSLPSLPPSSPPLQEERRRDPRWSRNPCWSRRREGGREEGVVWRPGSRRRVVRRTGPTTADQARTPDAVTKG